MRYLGLLVFGALVLATSLVGQAAAGGAALVTTAADSGPGSFRTAVAAANADSAVGQIVFVGNLAPTSLTSPVTYVGAQSLTIVGNGSVLDGQGFVAETYGDLSVSGLTIRNSPSEGLTYEVPSDASGTKRVSLSDVRVEHSDGHGVLINDQTFPEEAGDPDAEPPVPPNPAGSSASLEVSVANSVFDDNGFGVLDRDGLRINEGAVGDLSLTMWGTAATDNGADGVELDERGSGNAAFVISGSTITGNGSFDLANPDPDERDLDDGMDVDESSTGDLIGSIANSVASDNFEEGWDLNENDAGDLRVEMTNAQASRNLEEGVDLEEDDDFAGGGDLVTALVNVTADENEGGDAGLKIREKGEGNLRAGVRGAQANGNEGDGVNVREDAAGDLAASVDHSTTNANGDDGINFDENSDGDLSAVATHGTSADNDDDGIVGDEGGGGSGTLDALFMTLGGNGGDDVVLVGNVTLTRKP